MTLLLDAGALIALACGERQVWRRLKHALDADEDVVTHGAVVGQVWRGGSGPQALLSRALAGIEIAAIDDDLGRRAGFLLGAADLSDVVDAALVALATHDDRIVTSDPDDLTSLVEAAGLRADVVTPAGAG